jgi:hypothetical protein
MSAITRPAWPPFDIGFFSPRHLMQMSGKREGEEEP